MEEAARRYARRVLLIHLLLLVVIVAGVVVAARGVYTRAREQAVAQYLGKQELLAQQTGNGIDAHYRAIVSSMDILEHDQQNVVLPFRIGGNLLENMTKLVGHQLTGPNGQDRVAALLVVGRAGERPPGMERARPRFGPGQGGPGQGGPGDRGGPAGRGEPPVRGERPTPPQLQPTTRPGSRDELVVLGSYPPTIGRPQQERFVAYAGESLRQISKPTITEPWKFSMGTANVIVYPSKARQWVNTRWIDEIWFIAVVPIENVQARFLDELNRRRSADHTADTSPLDIVASLIDDRAVVIASSGGATDARRPAVGSPIDPSQDPAIAKAVEDCRKGVLAGRALPVSFRTSRAELATIEPVQVCDKTWFLYIASPGSTVDDMVMAVFRKALWWAIFVVAAMTGLLVSSSTSLIRSQLRMERIKNEMMSRELAQARKIQLAWLPQGRDAAGVDIAAVNEPANHVSGDFYDWFDLPDGRTVITIGDVTGHGMSAAFLMATTQLLIRNTMMRVGHPGACLAEVNQQLCGQVFNGQFVTVCILVIDPHTRAIEVGNAGHFPPLLHDGNNVVPLDADSQLVLGVEFEEKYPTEEFILPESYTLLLYTDGVVDARAGSGEPFGGRRLRQILSRSESASSVLMSVTQEIGRFRGGADLVDDLTMVAIQGQAIPVRPTLSPQVV